MSGKEHLSSPVFMNEDGYTFANEERPLSSPLRSYEIEVKRNSPKYNMIQTSEKMRERIPDESRLSNDEYNLLYELIISGRWAQAIEIAFNCGYARGSKFKNIQ